MTGGLGELIDITNKATIPSNLYDLLWNSSQMNSMIGGSIHLPERSAGRPEVRRSNGLYMGHAYSVTALSVVPWKGRNVRLLRLRNPWGRKEWTGPWSDVSDEIRNLPMELKKKLNIVIEEDGEFWISYDDFLANFDEVQLCHLQPDTVALELANKFHKRNWSVTVYHDAWIKGVTAGGCGNRPYQRQYWSNPQFQVQLKDVDERDNKNTCTMIVTLMEKEKDNRSNIAIGFDIYQVRNPQSRPLNGDQYDQSQLVHRERSGKYQYYRELVHRYELPPGVYIIIPSTFHPNEEAEFLLRLFTEKEIDSTVIDDVGSPVAANTARDRISEMFSRYAGEDGKMDYKELQKFLTEATRDDLKEPITFNLEACRSLVTMLDNNSSGYLDEDEAKKVLREVKTYVTVFRKFDKDKSNAIDTLELGTMLNKLGFPVSRLVLTSIVRRYGGRQRTISLEDFVIVICKLITMFNVFKDQHEKTGGPDDVAQFTRNEFLQYTMYC